MEILALLSNRDDIISVTKNALRKFTVYPLKTVEELEDLYSNMPLNLLLIDTVSHRLSFLENFLNKLDNCKALFITAEKPGDYISHNLPGNVYGCIAEESIREDLPVMVERAIESQRMKNEISLLRGSHNKPVLAEERVSKTIDTMKIRDRGSPAAGGRFPHERIIVSFARMLSVSFDMGKLFDHFIDSVTEIVRVSKMSVILRDRDCFRVKTHYGLDPYIAENLKIEKESELILCLNKTGRIMHKPVAFEDPGAVNIRKEMELLQCVVSFPMMYKGKLIGIFNIDNKITEEPFYPEELEIIYVLCNYLAAAVKDIDLYHQMWYQKEFNKNLISSMSSGIIAIDKERNITIFNRQASDILGLDPSDMIGRNFKALPAPMGDLLYDTMAAGTSYKRHEVSVDPLKLPLGINSYRLMDEKQEPIGAGIIFTDLSDSRKMEEQNRRADHLKIVNDLIAKIAHEVRNPLTSIQTYTQLLNEKSNDDELKNFFVSTVSQSIKNLDTLIDKLVSFSSTQDYNFQREDLNDLMYGIANFVSKKIPGTHKFSIKLSDGRFYINADKKQLTKALYYLALSIVDKTPDGTSMKMVIDVKDQDISKAVMSIKYSGESPLERGEQELLKPLLDTDNLGTELNIPICSKIIEGHAGSLEIKSEGSVNTFVISLPVFYMKNDTLSVKGGHTSGN